MSPSVSTYQKAYRYLTSGLVTASCGERGLELEIRGDSGIWHVVLDDRSLPYCTCPSRVARCSHVIVYEILTRGQR
jgi:hypothetical protein